MRTVGGSDAAQPEIDIDSLADYFTIEVADHADALVDLTEFAVSLEYEQTTDEIVDAATVVFRRLSGASSLAPLMTATPPVALGRRIVISTNPGGGSREIFRGQIHDVDWPERFGDVTVQCMDRAGIASRTWIEDPIEYSTTAGVALETVMQAVADDNLTTSFTLNFPGGATGEVVQHAAGDPPYGPSEQSTLDALRALAESIGFTIRWRHFDSTASDWKWTAFAPSRSKTAPDHTFAAADYWEVTQMEQSDEDIRNVVDVEYTHEGGARGVVRVEDAASIATYGRRYMKISEPDVSPVNSLDTANALANAALSDLKEPDALLEIECPYFWPGEVGVDLYRFTANNKHFSSDQDLAAMAFRHKIAVGERPTTWIMTRGKPSGGVLMWKRRIGQKLPTTIVSDINVANFREVERSQTTVTLGWDNSGEIDEVWVWYATPAQPLASDPWANFTGTPTVRLTADSESYAIAIPDYGAVTYVQIVPIGVRANVVVRGNPARFTVQGEQVRLIQSAEVTGTSSTQCTVRVKVANPIAGGDITVTPTALGCTISPTGAQTISSGSVTALLSTTGYVDYTVTRPAFQAGSGRVTFVASATDRLQDTDSVDIPAQERDTQGVQVRIERVSETGSDIVVRVKGITPNAAATCTVTYDAGGLTVSPASGGTFAATTAFGTTNYIDYTITRPAYTGAMRRVAFTLSASGNVDGTDGVDVPPMARDLAVNKLTASEITVVSLSAIVADMGTLTAGKIDVGNIEINATTEQILFGSATAPLTGLGIFIGKDGSDYEFRAGDPAGAYMHWTGAALTLVSPTVTSPVITTPASGSSESLLGLSHDLVFTASDSDTVAWAAGTITFSNGASYSISSGNTGNIAALTYVYLDPATSATVLQTTTTASTAIGHRKVLVATAKNVADAAKLAEFSVFGGAGGVSKTISTNMIAANAITANEINAGAVTAGKISVSSLAAIQAELGAVTFTGGTSDLTFKESGDTVGFIDYTPLAAGGPPAFSLNGVNITARKKGAADTTTLELLWLDHAGDPYGHGTHAGGLLHSDADGAVFDGWVNVGTDLAVTGDITCDDITIDAATVTSMSLAGNPLSFGANDSAGAGYRLVRVPN